LACRAFLSGTLWGAAAGALAPPLGGLGSRAVRAAMAGSAMTERFTFAEIEHGVDETHHVAPGYTAEVLIRWGDPVVPGAPPFDPLNQSAEAQEKQFGYNNDFVGYLGLPFGSGNPERGLLCVNHEYTNREVMFAKRRGRPSRAQFEVPRSALVEIEMAAHGGSVIEIEKRAGRWRVVPDSPYNRRITARSTAMEISGPAAGHPRLRTSADPGGRRVIGTVANCAGGMTPWGTYLMAEENFNSYFSGTLEAHPEARNFARYDIPKRRYAWARYHRRFDINAEPYEANRFGWVVEVDPLAPRSTPKKRTALGRFMNEGAESIVSRDGRVVVYQGDDGRFEYLYRFVTEGRFDPKDRTANSDLLDRGTLSVARFDEDGSLVWLPLVFSQEPLSPANGFASQADVLIEARRAADLLGATPMDRPEDVEPNPVTGKVYVMLTNNDERTVEQIDGPNPRDRNLFGHILELTPPDGDHAAAAFDWDVLVRCGDPASPEADAAWNPSISANGWFAGPDNCAIDGQGRLWIASDQGGGWVKNGTADGLWALETENPLRGMGRMFFRVPIGAELCGPRFTPDDKTLFVAVQHVAVSGVEAYPDFGRRSTFERPATRWPDFDKDMPPRPSVVAITKDDGGTIGT
jgi:secreted PhoX family phosphatase